MLHRTSTPRPFPTLQRASSAHMYAQKAAGSATPDDAQLSVENSKASLRQAQSRSASDSEDDEATVRNVLDDADEIGSDGNWEKLEEGLDDERDEEWEALEHDIDAERPGFQLYAEQERIWNDSRRRALHAWAAVYNFHLSSITATKLFDTKFLCSRTPAAEEREHPEGRVDANDMQADVGINGADLEGGGLRSQPTDSGMRGWMQVARYSASPDVVEGDSSETDEEGTASSSTATPSGYLNETTKHVTSTQLIVARPTSSMGASTGLAWKNRLAARLARSLAAY